MSTAAAPRTLLPPESAAFRCEETIEAFSSVPSFALVSDKLYQRKEPVISSVHTKVKGIAEVTESVTEGGVTKLVSSIFDTADYTFPLQVSAGGTPGHVPVPILRGLGPHFKKKKKS